MFCLLVSLLSLEFGCVKRINISLSYQSTTWCQDDFIPDHRPEPFNFTHTEEWPRWIRRFERFRQASGLVEKSEENLVNTLIYSMGDNADDIFLAFKLSVEDMKKYDMVKGKFDNYFVKKKNIIYERAKFNSR